MRLHLARLPAGAPSSAPVRKAHSRLRAHLFSQGAPLFRPRPPLRARARLLRRALPHVRTGPRWRQGGRIPCRGSEARNRGVAARRAHGSACRVGRQPERRDHHSELVARDPRRQGPLRRPQGGRKRGIRPPRCDERARSASREWLDARLRRGRGGPSAAVRLSAARGPRSSFRPGGHGDASAPPLGKQHDARRAAGRLVLRGVANTQGVQQPMSILGRRVSQTEGRANVGVGRASPRDCAWLVQLLVSQRRDVPGGCPATRSAPSLDRGGAP
mmetsp:Transcript_19357/g.58428  ORF Transcript_19357/g.58428 Transcript_19357/m.58428 type:complete len:273 (-) Transcript_19357:653-1471(-)